MTPIIGRQQPFVEKPLNPHPAQRMLEPDGGITMRMPPRHTAGFTLIELMIVVAIIGILSAIAYPSYQNYVRKSRRAHAHAMLQAAQVAEEKWRVSNTTYTATVANLTGVSATSEGGYYTLTIANNSGTDYTLTATAVNGTSQANDAGCTAITITQTNGVVQNGPSNTCWNK